MACDFSEKSPNRIFSIIIDTAKRNPDAGAWLVIESDTLASLALGAYKNGVLIET
jgi:hypothetical protein